MSVIGSELSGGMGAEDILAARLQRQAEGLAAHVLRRVRAGQIGEPILTRTSRFKPFPEELSETAVGMADNILGEADLTITAHDKDRRQVIIPGFFTIAGNAVTVERIGHLP